MSFHIERIKCSLDSGNLVGTEFLDTTVGLITECENISEESYWSAPGISFRSYSLFAYMFNDLSTICTDTECQMYADDAGVLCFGKESLSGFRHLK